MNTETIKEEIHQIVNNLPDTILEDILSYLKKVGDNSIATIEQNKNLQKIILEDRELLTKLAQ